MMMIAGLTLGAASPAKAAFLIDAGQGVSVPLGTFAITTNGSGDWILGWRADADGQSFTGSVYALSGFSSATIFNAEPGDSISSGTPLDFSFDAVAQLSSSQYIAFSTADASDSVTFDLAIDGNPAIWAVVFSSGYQLATTDIMPFELVVDGGGGGGGGGGFPGVPEPGTWLLTGSAACGAVALKRLRRTA